MRHVTLKHLGIYLAAATIYFVAQGEAMAEFTLTPGISLKVEYDDNLFLTNGRAVEDLSTIIIPSLSLILKRKHLHTDLSYALEFRKYLDETYLDEDKIEDIHRADISGSIFPEKDFSTLYEGSIDRIVVDDRRSDVAASSIVNVTTRYDALVRPRYLYRLSPRVTGELAYQYSTSQYEDTTNIDISDGEANDINDHDIYLLAEMDYSEKLKLHLETYYNWHESDEFNDYEMWHGLAGFVWSPLSNFSLEAKAGGATTNLDDSDDDINDSLYRIVLNYSQPERWSFFTSYIKDFETSVDDGRYKWWEAAGGATYVSRLSGEIRLYTRENTYQFIDRKDEIYGVETKLGYELTANIATGFFADYSNRTYIPVYENVHRYRAGCTLTRTFASSSLTLAYNFNRNDSDIEVNDYLGNIVSLEYSIIF